MSEPTSLVHRTTDRVLIVSILDENKALGAPVSAKTPQDQWRRKFSHPFGQETIRLYKLRPYRLEDLASMRDQQRILTREDLDDKTRKDVKRIMLRLFLDNREHISTNIRNMKKYRTDDGKTAIVLTCREVNRYIGFPIVLIREEDPMVPRPIDKKKLVAKDGHRGDRLTRPERLLVADVLERILRGIPDSTLAPLPAQPEKVQQILQLLTPASEDCNQLFRASMYPYIVEMMCATYYRHLACGCVADADLECLPCDTMDALMSHGLDVCNAASCPQKQLLTRAFAMHVMTTKCRGNCFIPFCGETSHLVRPEDAVTPSPWLIITTMEKMQRHSRDHLKGPRALTPVESLDENGQNQT